MRSLTRRYYLFRSTLSAGFYLPISVIYLEAQGLNLADIGLVQGAFLFAMVAAELPTGYLGDRIGRRAALAVGNSLLVGVMVGFTLADTTLGFVGVYVLWAIGWTFRTGTSDAWLFELLAETDLAGEFERISGRAEATQLVVSAGAALLSGLLYTVDPTLPFYTNAVLAALGLPILYSLPRTQAVDGDGDARMGIREAARVLRTHLSRVSIRWVVVYAALFNVAFSVTRVFEQPAMREIGIPIVGLGALYAAFKVVSAGAASAAGALHDRLGTHGVLFMLVPVTGLLYGSFALFPLLLVPALFYRRAVQKVSRPVRNGYINDRLDDVGRATVLSGVSMALSLASGTANVLGGHVAEAVGPVTFLSATGVAVAALAGFLWVGVQPVREPSADEVAA